MCIVRRKYPGVVLVLLVAVLLPDQTSLDYRVLDVIYVRIMRYQAAEMGKTPSSGLAPHLGHQEESVSAMDLDPELRAVSNGAAQVQTATRWAKMALFSVADFSFLSPRRAP